MPRFIDYDQYGERVDLYDFAGHGRYVMIDMGTEFCDPCKDLAAYLATGDTSHLVWKQDEETGEDEYYPWWNESYEGLAEHVNTEINRLRAMDYRIALATGSAFQDSGISPGLLIEVGKHIIEGAKGRAEQSGLEVVSKCRIC